MFICFFKNYFVILFTPKLVIAISNVTNCFNKIIVSIILAY